MKTQWRLQRNDGGMKKGESRFCGEVIGIKKGMRERERERERERKEEPREVIIEQREINEKDWAKTFLKSVGT